jgi:phosphoribosylformimino-5-aminoimidazole carboxamide ribotide isomerase
MPSFAIIPVIDLMGGQVVHARGGARDAYPPLVSPLTASSKPFDVVAGLLALHRFRQLYIADLDAILKRGEHIATVLALQQAYPQLELWVDAGFAALCTCRRFLRGGMGQLVLGSESQLDGQLLGELAHDPRVILSLDFRGEDRLGPAELFEQPELWPERVIVMTLAAVGASGGPDVTRLRQILAAAGERKVYAAGGVRGTDDLGVLRELGCAGVLVASALHDGRLGKAELAACS